MSYFFWKKPQSTGYCGAIFQFMFASALPPLNLLLQQCWDPHEILQKQPFQWWALRYPVSGTGKGSSSSSPSPIEITVVVIFTKIHRCAFCPSITMKVLLKQREPVLSWVCKREKVHDETSWAPSEVKLKGNCNSFLWSLSWTSVIDSDSSN